MGLFSLFVIQVCVNQKVKVYCEVKDKNQQRPPLDIRRRNLKIT